MTACIVHDWGQITKAAIVAVALAFGVALLVLHYEQERRARRRRARARWPLARETTVEARRRYQGDDL